MSSLNFYFYLGSLIFQVSAVLFALRMMRTTRHRAPWLVMAIAFTLMTAYRSIGLLSSGDRPILPIPPAAFATVSATMSCAISAFLFASLFAIRRLSTSEREADDARRRSENRLRSLIDNSPSVIFIKDVDGRFQLVNKPFADAAGLQAEQMLGLRDSDLHSPEAAAAFRADDLAVARSGIPTTKEESFQWKGQDRTFVTTKFPLLDDAGRVASVCGIATDVTELKRVEAAARESDDRLRLALDAANMGIWEWHLGSQKFYWSASASRIFGLPEPVTETTGEFFSSLIHPEDRRRVWATAIAAVDRRVPFECDFRIVCPDGEVRWLSDRGQTIYASDGKPLRLLGTITDITDRVRRERELHESRERLAAALSASKTGTFRWDMRTGTLTWDDNLDHLFGLPPGQTARSLDQFLALIHADDRQGVIETCTRCREEGTDFSMEFRVVWPDGSVHWLDDQGKTFFDADGKPSYMTGACVDITARKSVEQAILAARDEAERANRTKDEFLAALSHELRTPLAPVLLSTQLLEHDASLPANVRADLHNIRKSIEIETRLIDDLLDLTRVARGKLELHTAAVDVHDVIRHSIDTCRDDTFLEKRLTLVTDLSASRSHVDGDPARLGQVVWNLLKNAVKFTPGSGTITIRTRDDGPRLVIEVSDTGIGIGPDVLPHIFNAFEQGGVQVTRRFGGLGLGLSITRALTELHHGTIKAHSDGPGHGSTFTVELPALPTLVSYQSVPSTDTPHALPPRCKHTPHNILLVEDHDQTGRIMSRLLSSFGYDVEWAQSVDSALRAASLRKFDLVVSDLGLPDGSGHDLMVELRRQYGLKGVAISGYGMEQDLDRSARSGFLRHLTKPVTIEKLDAAIRDVFTAEAPQPVETAGR